MKRDMTIGEIVAKDYRAASVFKEAGIDFCCGGKQNIDETCSKLGIDRNELVGKLDNLESIPNTTTHNFIAWDSGFLCDYIVNTHHKYVLKSLPELVMYTEKIASVHFFPALKSKGFSAEQGPVAVMLHEHTQGRSFVKGIADNLELYKEGDKAALVEIYINMLGYADLLSNHIKKENNILFRMADKVLSDPEQEKLLKQFETIEQNRPAATRVEDYINLINALALIYKV